MISSSYPITNNCLTISQCSSVSNLGTTRVGMVCPTMLKSITDGSLTTIESIYTAYNDATFNTTIERNTNDVVGLVGLTFDFDAFGTQELASPADPILIRKPIKTFT